MENVKFNQKIEYAWSSLCKACYDRDLVNTRTYFFWLLRLEKLKAESVQLSIPLGSPLSATIDIK